MSNGLDAVAGSETYQAGTGETTMPTNGGNYGTTPAPEGGAATPTPQGETTMTAGDGPTMPVQISSRLSGNSMAPMPTPDN